MAVASQTLGEGVAQHRCEAGGEESMVTADGTVPAGSTSASEEEGGWGEGGGGLAKLLHILHVFVDGEGVVERSAGVGRSAQRNWHVHVVGQAALDSAQVLSDFCFVLCRKEWT